VMMRHWGGGEIKKRKFFFTSPFSWQIRLILSGIGSPCLCI